MFNLIFLQILFFNFILFIFGCLYSCSINSDYGFLEVSSLYNGEYELYKIINEDPLLLSAQKIINFNESTKLKSGTYLVLADCSSQIVVLYPKKQLRLVVNTLKFIPPFETQSTDLFTIKCSRFDKTNMNQSFQNKYVLNVLDATKEILVGNKTINISRLEDNNLSSLSNKEPKEITFKLGALRVKNFSNIKDSFKYFVYSSSAQKVDVTLSQELGKNLLLLPESYIVALNGTTYEAVVKENELKEITPALFEVKANIEQSFDFHPLLKSEASLVQLNKEAVININETYPILPGKHIIKLPNNEKNYELNVCPQESKVLELKSLIVYSSCSAFDAPCMGKSVVNLFDKEADHPFAKGYTDIPILFLENDIYVGIDSSQDIRFKLPTTKSNVTIRTGILVIKPIHTTNSLQITDLLRVEAINKDSFYGKTYDIPLTNLKTTMLIPQGSYVLKHYISTKQSRYSTATNISINPNTINVIEPIIFISEDKLNQIKLKKEKYRRKKISKIINTLRHQKYLIPPSLNFF